MSYKKYYDTLFEPNEYTCWAKDPRWTRVSPVSLWIQNHEANFVCINPLYATLDNDPSTPTRSASIGRRADCNVSSFRNILCEFDKGDLNEQKELIQRTELPYSTLVYSGGKSLHAVVSLETPCATRDEYKRLVKRIYDKLPTVDKSASNPSRFTRAPGASRVAVVQALLDVKPRIPLKSLESWLGPEPEPPPEPKYKLIGLGRCIRPATRAFLLGGSPDGGWNNSLFKAVADLTRAGFSPEEILDRCTKITGYLDESDLRTIASAIRTARQAE